jgi:hypothetical protein
VTVTEKALLALIVAGLVAALFLPVVVTEAGVILQIVVLGFVALGCGGYVWWVNRGLTRQQSEYLWRQVRRDNRVTIALAMLGILGLAIVVPRLNPDVPVLFQRPWAIVWLVIAIDLLAVGLIDDAVQMRRDRRVG